MKAKHRRTPRLPETLCIPVGAEGEHVALVDEQDFWALSEHTWYLVATKTGHKYAIRNTSGRPVYMHRDVMSPAPGLVVDHINRNGLDNRRSNLRVCSQSQNCANKRKGVRHDGGLMLSRFKGVSVNGTGFVATCDRKYVGTFRSEEEAAHAYDDAARAIWGEYARLNFPRRGERPANISAAA